MMIFDNLLHKATVTRGISIVIGLIKGLFSSKDANETVPAPKPEPKVRPQKSSQAYFLDMDNARTMGNVDYMRTAKTVRRTFPKTLNSEEKEMVREISAMQMAEMNGKAAPAEMPEGGSVKSTRDEVAERRRTDTSLDMFLGMAKDMRKS